jgi:two-component system, LuxR family, sensor kinase FixL
MQTEPHTVGSIAARWLRSCMEAPLAVRLWLGAGAAAAGMIAVLALTGSMDAFGYALLHPATQIAAVAGGFSAAAVATALSVGFLSWSGETSWLHLLLFAASALAVAAAIDLLRDACRHALLRQASQEFSVEPLLRDRVLMTQQLSGIAASVPGVIYTYRLAPDGGHSFPYVSANVQVVLGLAADEVIGDAEAFFRRLDPQDLPGVMESVADSVRSLTDWQREFRFDHPQKGEIWIEGHSSPLQAPDGAVVWHGYIQDVTERKRDEERIRALHEGRMSMMRTIASGLAHEISQPLTAAVAYIRTIRRLLDTPPERRPISIPEGLDKAASQISRAGAIVSRLRDFIAHGEPHKTTFRLHDLILETCKPRSPRAGETEVAIAFRLDARSDEVFADRVQIGQVLANLISNALDAMEKTSRRDLVVATESVENGVRVDVCDTGVGMTEGSCKKMFEPFMSTKITGMGVGLSMSRAIVQAHDGQMSAVANPDGGLTLSFTLPIEP